MRGVSSTPGGVFDGTAQRFPLANVCWLRSGAIDGIPFVNVRGGYTQYPPEAAHLERDSRVFATSVGSKPSQGRLSSWPAEVRSTPPAWCAGNQIPDANQF